VSKINLFKFLGGAKDGLALENNVGFTPDVIDGEAIHLFGEGAYALVMIDHENSVAIYEHMKLINDPSASGLHAG